MACCYKEYEIVTNTNDHQDHADSIHLCYHNVETEHHFFHTNLLVR